MADLYDPLKLENQICFPLYACAKEIVKAYKPYLDELNLTYTQYITMMVMWGHKELRVKEVGEKLFLDSSTLTPLLKELEEKGYVTRRRSEADERDVFITITDSGEALKENARTVRKTGGLRRARTPEGCGTISDTVPGHRDVDEEAGKILTRVLETPGRLYYDKTEQA